LPFLSGAQEFLSVDGTLAMAIRIHAYVLASADIERLTFSEAVGI
jgi:hypothetical protein